MTCDRLTKRVLSGPFEAVGSCRTSRSPRRAEYTSTEDDERARLEAEGRRRRAEAALAEWRERMATYLDHRLHPRLPAPGA
ncbi:MAG: hypothetical protein KatS3mg010_2136 [Acidimicrobiia bacterium]|nr:MAG: hypothetical protein KatS3mg010_2136 [Acidimicrobiia bacterium]